MERAISILGAIFYLNAILFIPPLIPAGIHGILEFQWNSGESCPFGWTLTCSFQNKNKYYIRT